MLPENIQSYLKNYQLIVCKQLQIADPDCVLIQDNWQHHEINLITGNTAILSNGKFFEHAGIGFSLVSGKHLPPAATKRNPRLTNYSFEAMGVSIIIHPLNPYIPTTHANLRFFIAYDEKKLDSIWWFGGGFDLTPYYPFMEDCKYWHSTANSLCTPFGKDVYQTFKCWCDKYFYLPHRKETRGVGGIFFDDLNYWPFEQCFNFLQAVGNGFLAGYLPIVEKRKHTLFTQQEREFQLYRRGRYVEFNLLYDRGTLFGLQSGGRTESILMSLPPQVNWRYNYQPQPDSKEANLANFLQAQEWLTK